MVAHLLSLRWRVMLNGFGSADEVAAARAACGDAPYSAADMSKPDEVRAMVAECERTLGRLDILVNNAGINVRKPVEQLALDEWRQVLDTNLTSAFLCCRAAHPLLKAAGGGKVIHAPKPGSKVSYIKMKYMPFKSARRPG